MQDERSPFTRPRVAFLLLLSLAITVLFYWLIGDFVVALLVAAVLATLLHPLYLRILRAVGDRKAVASGVTVLLSLLLVVVPLALFFAVLAGEAISISEAATDWIAQQTGESGTLHAQLEQDPDLRKLVPYQDQIMEKASELTSDVGSFVASELADSAKGTAEFFLMLFVMLYAMFFFLIDGRTILDGVLRFTPLSADDKGRLLGTFASVGRATIKGTLVIGIVQGGLAGLAFWVAGIGGAVFWGVVMGVLSVLPGIGAALVWIPAVIFLALDGRIGAAVGLGLWCAIVVGTADNFLRPVLIGRDTEMPDLLVLLTTLGGLALFGVPGLVIGPLIGALYVAVWKLWGSAIDEARGESVGVATTTEVEEGT
jgi:predicted PurR-regulated permease PerM